ncbi:hypothetical protein [Halobellus inordinatus]|uniref:hypothetical protein n=1 Tax=Halobellus inordinatus TaxID=1126236 RepID=UPI00211431B3|nr:hypothetical protein [Halobellus ramosii]
MARYAPRQRRRSRSLTASRPRRTQRECKVCETGEQCPARKYRDADELCAHLCTIRKALVLNDKADDGTTIEVFDRDDVEAAAADAHIAINITVGGITPPEVE